MLFYGNLLKKFRESKKMTLLQLGEKIGVSKQTVQKYETGKTNPKPAKVYKIAKALGVSVVDISDLNPEKDFCMNRYEILPSDDFFKIILESWPSLTNTDRLNLASEASRRAETNRGVPPSSSLSDAEKKKA